MTTLSNNDNIISWPGNRARAIEQPVSVTETITLDAFQARVSAWHRKAFGEPATQAATNERIRALFQKMVEEAQELLEALDDPDNRGEELADVLVCALGLADYMGERAAWQLDRKIRIIEHRPVIVGEDGHRRLGKGPYG